MGSDCGSCSDCCGPEKEKGTCKGCGMPADRCTCKPEEPKPASDIEDENPSDEHQRDFSFIEQPLFVSPKLII